MGQPEPTKNSATFAWTVTRSEGAKFQVLRITTRALTYVQLLRIGGMYVARMSIERLSQGLVEPFSVWLMEGLDEAMSQTERRRKSHICACRALRLKW